MSHPAPIRYRKPSEDGYMLLAVMFMLVLVVLSLAVAAPRMAKSIQRDREMETMERGKQYIRAIQLYYRKFQSYPPSLDALEKTNNIRFLRKKYVDPLTGKPDWKPILFGQNKAPLAMGFFGQPLGGVGGAMPVAGIGPSGGNMPQGNGLGAGMGSSLGGGIGSSMGGGIGSSMGGGIGSSFGGGTGSSPGGSTFGSTNSGTAPTAGGTSTGSSDNGGSSTPGSGSSTTGTGGSSGTGFMSGQSGQTFGGGGIIGVEPVLDKPSIFIYKKMSRYNQWEFTYSPLIDMMKQMGAGGAMALPGGGTAQPGTPGFGSPGAGGSTGPGFGGSTGPGFGGSSGPGFGGSSGGFGSTPTQPTQPTQPQQ
jgi:type II secretory pathway pseudopilin PulG